MPDVENSGTSEALTVESIVPDFESLLSDESEDQQTNESQPTQAQSPALESEDGEVEASSEQAQPAEDETEPTEQTDDESSEPSPIPASLDPNVMVKVKVDGEDTEITLGEALKGYSREAVFTRRMQEVAEQRRAVEQIDQALRGEREAVAAHLKQLQQVVRQQTQEPDWEQIQRDHPDDFAALWAQHARYKEQVAEIDRQAAEAEKVVIRDRQKALDEHLKSERSKLLDAIPEWKDEAKAKAEKQKVATYAQEKVGFSAEEIGQLRDHRGLVVLRKAMLWDALQAKKPEIAQRIETVKVSTPGSAASRPRVSKSSAAFARLAKSGSMEDFAAGIMDSLDD